MPDPDDFRHSKLPDVYNLALRVRPGSVRDAIWRAETLCGAVKRPVTGDEFLVAGDGPAGIAATLALLTRGFRVRQFNRGIDDGSIQLSSMRMLCPTTADFPKSHWTVREHPPRADVSTVLPWGHGWASDVLEDMRFTFWRKLKLINPGSRYTPTSSGEVTSVEAIETNPNRGRLRVRLKNVAIGRVGPSTEDVDAVVLCIGFGQEKLGKRFASYGFFSNVDPIINTPDEDASRRVLIVGGGDGALGDFVRLKTRFTDPFELLKKLDFPPSVLTNLERLHAELWRELTTVKQRPQAHDPLVAAQVQLSQAIDDLWADPTVCLRDKIRDVLDDAGSTPVVQLAMQCFHFDIASFANRILAQAVARGLATDIGRRNGGAVPFRVGARSLSYDGHKCVGDAEDCAGTPHYATFEPARCYDSVVPPQYVIDGRQGHARDLSHAIFSIDLRSDQYDRILLRAGPDFHEADDIKAMYSDFNNVYFIWDAPPFSV